MANGEPPASEWPAEPAEVFEGAVTCEYASLTRAGAPVTVPTRGQPKFLLDDELALRVGPRAPELSPGPACLTVHGHADQFTGQENHTLVGTLLIGADGPRLRIQRALADWSLPGSRAQVAIGFLAKGRVWHHG